jgi:hypothetical protein
MEPLYDGVSLTARKHPDQAPKSLEFRGAGALDAVGCDEYDRVSKRLPLLTLLFAQR